MEVRSIHDENFQYMFLVSKQIDSLFRQILSYADVVLSFQNDFWNLSGQDKIVQKSFVWKRFKVIPTI